jgi:hypothetical protein
MQLILKRRRIRESGAGGVVPQVIAGRPVRVATTRTLWVRHEQSRPWRLVILPEELLQ